MRCQAENLVRNVLLHQISNALEESDVHFDRPAYFASRRKTCVGLDNERTLLRGLLGGNYARQVSFDGRRERGKSVE